MRFHTGEQSPELTYRNPELTYSDVFLIPQLSDIRSRLEPDLTPPDETGATIPIVVANMNAVAGRRMAETVARRGGLTVLSQDLSQKDLERKVQAIKEAHPVYDTPIQLGPKRTIQEAAIYIDKRAHGSVIIVKKHQPIGIVAQADLNNNRSLDSATRVSKIMTTQIESMPEGLSPEEMHVWLHERRLKVAPVVGHKAMLGVMTIKGALRSSIYQPGVDAEGRLLVAAAIGINDRPGKKAKLLREMGVDIIVIDTAHGHQQKMLEAIMAVRDKVGEGVCIVAGNVVTREATENLLTAGADIVKVGVGPGAMCTTRMMTGVGRPQFSAVLECARMARDMGKHVWADGGIKYPRDVALALAAGASSVMIGSLFAGTHESAADMEIDKDGSKYKVNFGMASETAVSGRTEHLSSFEQDRRKMFDEGSSHSRMYVDPERPGVEDYIDEITAGVRSAMAYTGARTLDEFHRRAVVGVQSAAGYQEGLPHRTSW